MAKDSIVQRVVRRLQELRLGPVEAATAVPGLGRDFIRDLIEGKKNSFSQAKAPLLAQALHWSPAELLGEAQTAAPKADRGLVRVPLLDSVAAGKLTDPMSQLSADEVPKIPFSGLGAGEFFALKVEGDSMDRISPAGSVIVVNRSDRTLISNKAYVFWHRAEGTTFKLWQPSPPHLAPFSTNPSNKPIFVQDKGRKRDFEVIGRVKRTVLDL